MNVAEEYILKRVVLMKSLLDDLNLSNMDDVVDKLNQVQVMAEEAYGTAYGLAEGDVAPEDCIYEL